MFTENKKIQFTLKPHLHFSLKSIIINVKKVKFC